MVGLYTRPKTVTHPGTNRARRALTSFMRRTPLTTTPRRQPVISLTCETNLKLCATPVSCRRANDERRWAPSWHLCDCGAVTQYQYSYLLTYACLYEAASLKPRQQHTNCTGLNWTGVRELRCEQSHCKTRFRTKRPSSIATVSTANQCT